MIQIRPIRIQEIPAARHMILSVAYNIYGWSGTLEDSIRHFEASGEFHDMDEVQSHYFENDGLFLAVLDDDRLIGTGAVRKLNTTTCELKRLWLLEDFHGKRIGYQVFIQLLEFARNKNYRRMRLQTSPEQSRARVFYKKLGFYEIESYNEKVGEISMELKLTGTK
jgi:putative acetyltransferase